MSTKCPPKARLEGPPQRKRRLASRCLYRIFFAWIPRKVWFGNFLCIFESPEGRKQNSPGLQAWEGLRKKIALKGRQTSGRYSQNVTFVKSDSMAFQKQNLRVQLGAKETGPSNVITTYLCVGRQSLFGRPFRASPLCVRPPGPNAFGPGLFSVRPSGDGEVSKLQGPPLGTPERSDANLSNPVPRA